MIFTEEEYMELANAMPPAGPSRSNTVGAKNHIEDHNAIARVIWGPSGDFANARKTIIKVTKNADSITLAFDGDAENFPFDFEHLEQMMEDYKSYADFYDVIVSQEGLLDLHYTEWPVGAWYEFFIGGLMASMIKVDSFIRDFYGTQDDKMINALNLGSIWKLLKFSCDIQKHTHTSGVWSPPLPEMTDDMSMFDGANFFWPGAGASFREGQVLYSVRPKYLDTIKDLTTSLSTLESDNVSLNTTVSGLETDLGSLSSANDTLSSTVSTLEGNVATLTSGKEALEGQVSSLESSNGTLSSTVSTLESTVGDLTSDKETLEGQVSTLESTVADLTTRLEALENPTSPE